MTLPERSYIRHTEKKTNREGEQSQSGYFLVSNFQLLISDSRINSLSGFWPTYQGSHDREVMGDNIMVAHFHALINQSIN